MEGNSILIICLYLLIAAVGLFLIYVGIIDIQFVIVLSGIFGFTAICILLGLVMSEMNKNNPIMDNNIKELEEKIKELENSAAELLNIAHEFKLILTNKNKRIAELVEIAMELFELVHEPSNIAQNKIRANELYAIFRPD